MLLSKPSHGKKDDYTTDLQIPLQALPNAIPVLPPPSPRTVPACDGPPHTDRGAQDPDAHCGLRTHPDADKPAREAELARPPRPGDTEATQDAPAHCDHGALGGGVQTLCGEAELALARVQGRGERGRR